MKFVTRVKNWISRWVWHFLGTIQEPFYSWLNNIANLVIRLKNPERVVRCGPLHPDKTFYVIRDLPRHVGIAGWYDNVLGYMLRAKKKGWIPVVDPPPPREGDGDWFAFFKQVSPYTMDEVLKSENVVFAVQQGMIHKRYNKRNIQRRHELAKSISLSGASQRYIDDRLPKLFEGIASPVVAIYYRGTDYRTAIGHARVLSVKSFCDAVVKSLRDWNIAVDDGMHFLVVTEEQESLDKIREIFPKCNFVMKERYSNFKLGSSLWNCFLSQTTPIENNYFYLLDIYLMSRSDYLIGGVNGGVLMALNLNGNRYRGLNILNTGVN